MSHLFSRFRKRQGQVALEVLVVLAVWWMVIIIFINIMLALSSMMMVQSTVNRLAVQVGAMGCYPKRQFEADLVSTLGGFGISPSGPGSSSFQVEGKSWPIEKPPAGGAPLDTNLAPVVDIPSTYAPIPSCQPRKEGTITAAEDYVPSDSYVTVSLRYRQNLLFLKRDVVRSATTISSRLETE
jgi:hypothetical protein